MVPSLDPFIHDDNSVVHGGEECQFSKADRAGSERFHGRRDDQAESLGLRIFIGRTEDGWVEICCPKT